jgi:predicted hydrocarbon binding protein
MPRSASASSELALPVASLAALRAALAAEVGPDAAARALQRAGHAAGDAFFAILAGRQPESGEEGDPWKARAAALAPLPAETFWRRLGDLFAARGWGHIEHEDAHPGVGALASSDWVEAESHGHSRPDCHFTTGLLSNLLGRTAGGDVAVLEVECRSRGDLQCRFLFGGADAVQAVYDALLAGRDTGAALAALTESGLEGAAG